MSDNVHYSGGISFTGLLTIVFIILKLCKVIDWSWWWVCSPIWISILFVLGLLGIFAGFVFMVELIQAKLDTK